MTKRNLYTRTLINLIFALLLITPATWLTFTALCLLDQDGYFRLPICHSPRGGLFTVVAIDGLVIARVAWLALERTRRSVSRGLYARPVKGARFQAHGWLASVIHLAIEGEWPGQGGPGSEHPMWTRVPEGYGWQVPLEDGTAVILKWDEVWTLVGEAVLFQMDPANRRRGALSQRRLDPLIGRPKTLALNRLVEAAGGLTRAKISPNSTRRLCKSRASIMADLYERWPPGPVE